MTLVFVAFSSSNFVSILFTIHVYPRLHAHPHTSARSHTTMQYADSILLLSLYLFLLVSQVFFTNKTDVVLLPTTTSPISCCQAVSEGSDSRAAVSILHYREVTQRLRARDITDDAFRYLSGRFGTFRFIQVHCYRSQNSQAYSRFLYRYRGGDCRRCYVYLLYIWGDASQVVNLALYKCLLSGSQILYGHCYALNKFCFHISQNNLRANAISKTGWTNVSRDSNINIDMESGQKPHRNCWLLGVRVGADIWVYVYVGWCMFGSKARSFRLQQLRLWMFKNVKHIISKSHMYKTVNLIEGWSVS